MVVGYGSTQGLISKGLAASVRNENSSVGLRGNHNLNSQLEMQHKHLFFRSNPPPIALKGEIPGGDQILHLLRPNRGLEWY